MDQRVRELIQDAFNGETKAIVSYYMYADVARQEGLLGAAELFERMAQNEIYHAKVWYEYLFEQAGDTTQNLITAAQNENFEWKSMYPGFAERARELGDFEVADKFERIASIECEHERRFVEEKLVGTQQSALPGVHHAGFICLFCGFNAETAPEVCPVCNAEGSFVPNA